jgi:hypothetical protein
MERAPRLERTKSGIDRLEVWQLKAEDFFLGHTTAAECFEATMNPREGPRTRIFGLIGAALCLVRGAREQALLALHKPDDFSVLRSDDRDDASLAKFNPDLYEITELIGSGYWNRVYMTEPKQDRLERKVLKVEFPRKKYSEEELEEQVASFRDDYEFLKRVFEKIRLPNLIPFTEYLILRSPRTKQLAIAQFQSYAGDEVIDVMVPANKERVKKLLGDSSFKEEFDVFRTMSMKLRQTKEEPDFAGYGNIFAVRNGSNWTLRLVDPHRLHPNNSIAQDSQKLALEYLRSL